MMPRPADVVAQAAVAIKSLTDEQIVAVTLSARRANRKKLARCWEVVELNAPDLAAALDDLHAREIDESLPRFEALAAEHSKQHALAVTGRAGKATALLAIAALVTGTTTAILALTSVTGDALTVAGGIMTAGLLLAAYIGGQRLAQSGQWMLADPESSVAIVWDAGIDAAAVAALSGRVGEDGLTREVLDRLSAAWSGAGLEQIQLAPQRRTSAGEVQRPAALRAA